MNQNTPAYGPCDGFGFIYPKLINGSTPQLPESDAVKPCPGCPKCNVE